MRTITISAHTTRQPPSSPLIKWETHLRGCRRAPISRPLHANRESAPMRTEERRGRGERTHAAGERELPRGRAGPRAEQLLALVVRPEAAQRVAHLAHPRAADAVEEAARAWGGVSAWLGFQRRGRGQASRAGWVGGGCAKRASPRLQTPALTLRWGRHHRQPHPSNNHRIHPRWGETGTARKAGTQERARTGGPHGLLQALHHALVARRLQAHLRQVQRAVIAQAVRNAGGRIQISRSQLRVSKGSQIDHSG